MSDMGIPAILAAHTRHVEAHRKHHLAKVAHAAHIEAARLAAAAEHRAHDFPSGATQGDGHAVNG